MSFRITGLDPAPFIPLFGLPEAKLKEMNVLRYAVDAAPGYPDRIELRDAQPGESVLLVNFMHQPADTPYRASHAIFVREGATTAFDAAGVVPDVLRIRLISLRAFSAAGMLLDADVVQGDHLEPSIERLLGNPDVAYLQAHNAKQGCYAARVSRV